MKVGSLLIVFLCLVHSYSFHLVPSRRPPAVTLSQKFKQFASLPYNTKAYSNNDSNNEGSIGTSNDSDSLMKKIFQKIMTISEKLRSREWRDAFVKRIYRIAHAAKSNVSQDISTIGNRSEVWLPTISQILLVSFTIFGVPAAIEWLFHVCGILSSLCGLAFLSMGLWNLGENITVFVTPVNGNRLVTNGIYSLVRHPIYSGLLLMCSGFAIQSGSVSKLLISMALAVLTDKLCDSEEALLVDIHGHKAYSEYKGQVNKLIPYIY